MRVGIVVKFKARQYQVTWPFVISLLWNFIILFGGSSIADVAGR
jgi:hypothetical protein